MVFSNLQTHEKDAFFSLLDEYFSSRPEIFAHVGESEGSNGSAASAVHRVLASNPETTSRLASAALKHGLHRSDPAAAATSSDTDGNNTIADRIAAFSSHKNNNPPPPRRAPSTTDSSRPSPGPNLVSNRRFGDVDTTSTKNMFSSVLHSSANKNAVHQPPSAPAAFASKKNAFAPPPVRHVDPPAPPLAQRQQPEEEEEEQGEWAMALYDYNSGEAGDLDIRANQRVLVTERTSDDWWTGEFNGQRGLFPASYVNLV